MRQTNTARFSLPVFVDTPTHHPDKLVESPTAETRDAVGIIAANLDCDGAAEAQPTPPPPPTTLFQPRNCPQPTGPSAPHPPLNSHNQCTLSKHKRGKCPDRQRGREHQYRAENRIAFHPQSHTSQLYTHPRRTDCKQKPVEGLRHTQVAQIMSAKPKKR